MEGIREIARSYYDTASEDEKNTVRSVFSKIDVNGDGKISLREFKESVSSRLKAESLFERLDEDGNGTLDFDEFLCLYYLEKKLEILRCKGCWEWLVGPYFSCLKCLGKWPNTFDLCCSCYRRLGNLSHEHSGEHTIGSLSHEHSVEHMMDRYSLMKVFRERTAAAERSTERKKEMEQLREIARAHYRAGSREVQALAFEFYQAMDTNGDGCVQRSEFLDFMRERGYTHMRDTRFYDDLDTDDNGTLDFPEVMMLYYIIKSGRPFCAGCKEFIPGVFFSCVECFKDPSTTFALCLKCYQSSKYKHDHNGRTQFLDNYTLLLAGREPACARSPPGVYSNEASTSSTSAIAPVQYYNYTYNTYNTYAYHPPNPAPVYSNAIVPASASQWGKWSIALHALESAIGIGSIAGTMCTIL